VQPLLGSVICLHVNIGHLVRVPIDVVCRRTRDRVGREGKGQSIQVSSTSGVQSSSQGDTTRWSVIRFQPPHSSRISQSQPLSHQTNCMHGLAPAITQHTLVHTLSFTCAHIQAYTLHSYQKTDSHLPRGQVNQTWLENNVCGSVRGLSSHRLLCLPGPILNSQPPPPSLSSPRVCTSILIAAASGSATCLWP